jgi:hypothetical protein
MVRQSNTKKNARTFGTAACLVLGLGLVLSSAPANAQSGAAAGQTSTGSGANTAQPPAGADLDTDFWVLVRDSADPNALQSYLASFPSGKFINEARQKIAALRGQEDTKVGISPSESSPAPPPPPAAAPAPRPDNPELARALQRELKRVGCLDAEADGVWGDKSRAALKEFVRHANLSVAGDEPNLAALDAAQTKRARVCPLVCDDGERAVGDRCVPAVVNRPRQVRQQPAQQEQRRAQPRRAAAERPAAAPRASYSSGSGSSSNSGKRLCFGGGRNELVTCN